MAHILAINGYKRTTIKEVKFLMEPPSCAQESLQHDSLGGYITRKTSIMEYNNLAKLGNLSISNSFVIASSMASDGKGISLLH